MVYQLNMSRNKNENVQYAVSIEETNVNLKNRTSTLEIAICARLAPGVSESQEIKAYLMTITVDGVEYKHGNGVSPYTFNIQSGSWRTLAGFMKTVNLQHDSDGSLTAEISAIYDGDMWSPLLIGHTYLTIGERNVSFTCTQIDVSAPTVTSLQLTPGDYGRTLGIAYNISHSSYAIEKVELILQDYTMAQRDARHAAAQAVLPSAIITDLSDSELKITQMVNQQQTIEDVTITSGTVAQLLNGGIYRYQLTATAENGTTTIISSTYRVPCRVEGLAVEPQELFIRRGESAFVTLIYDPQDADIKTSTAEVDPGIYPHAWPVLVDGVATGEIVAGNSDGICSISFYSTDGAHAAQVIVTVGEHPSYPVLEIMTKLTPYQINRIQSAASFIADELDDLGIQVDELETVITTYAEEVTGIRAKLNALVGNCYKIKAATSGTAYDVTFASDLSYPETNASLRWRTVTNAMINFLNGTQAKIEA